VYDVRVGETVTLGSAVEEIIEILDSGG